MENNKKQTAVEWLTVEAMKLFTQAMTGTLNEDTLEDDVSAIITKAKAMEKKEKIEFACQVAEASAEKYIQGKTTWQIAEELLTFKSE